MTFSNLCNDIFWKSTTDYHVTDSVDAPMNKPYELKSIEYYLYLKNWIDAVQWHFEDIIRDPHIDPVADVVFASGDARYDPAAPLEGGGIITDGH